MEDRTMRKLFISALSMLAVAMGFTACSSDDDFVSNSDQSGRIRAYATTEQASATRTELNGNDTDGYQVFWSADDEITIGGKVFTLDEGDGTSTGAFKLKEGEENPVDGTDVIAYYPSTYDGTNWPTTQTYVAGNIPQGVPMKATGIIVEYGEGPMISPISFKNVGGILRLNLKGTAKVASIKISATNLTNPITLNCGSTGVELNTTTATPFHIAVQGTDEGTAYSGLKIEITDNTGAVCTKTAKSAITVQRSMITDITLTAGSFEHAYVEIAGIKWATENVGYVNGVEASATDETYGYYYTYDNALQAAASWGSNWELPTKEQWEALVSEDNCTWEWKTDYSFGGKTMNGYLVTDKNNGNSIFLPAAGFCGSNLSGQGDSGDYWSSTPVDSENAYELFIDSHSQEMYDVDRVYGYSVRPVFKETPATTGTAEVNESAGITGNKVNWVQLWAGGPKFAEFNVGVTDGKAESFGGYYAWGGTYQNGNGIAWNDDHNTGTETLSGDNDTATALWGSNWRMPTKDEWRALKSNCTYEKTAVNGVNGCIFTGKDDYKNNSIFLPAAGYCQETQVGSYNSGNEGYYWSSTPKSSSSTEAYFAELASVPVMTGYYARNFGYSVRAVLK